MSGEGEGGDKLYHKKGESCFEVFNNNVATTFLAILKLHGQPHFLSGPSPLGEASCLVEETELLGI